MKRTLLTTLFLTLFVLLNAQYEGEAWNGTEWPFGDDNAANFAVGSAITANGYTYSGIPHWAYDVGEVDLSKRCGEDPEGEFVAGNGTGKTGAGGTDRRGENVGGNSLTDSDNEARAGESGGIFWSHNARHTFNNGGAWTRTTCTFDEGNYQMLLRIRSNTNGNFHFYIRYYNTEMAPLYPWQLYHGGAQDSSALVNATIVDVTAEPYSALTNSDPGQTHWVKLNDIVTLNGDVVIEYSDPEPLSGYGSAGAQGVLAEMTFEYVGAASDQYAPNIGATGDLHNGKDYIDGSLDDFDTLKMHASEACTYYVVPKGTTAENAESAAIQSLTAEAGEVKGIPATAIGIGDSIQVIAKDAAGNATVSVPSARVHVTDITISDGGNMGDSIFVKSTRAGIMYIVPQGTATDLAALNTAATAANGDSTYITAGNNGTDTLDISGFADGIYMVYVYDTALAALSNGNDIKIEGGSATGFQESLTAGQVKVYPTFVENTLNIHANATVQSVQIFNTAGMLVMDKGYQTKTIQTESLNKGIYIVRIQLTDGSLHTSKVIKK